MELKTDMEYKPDPDCSKCQGAGFVHPRDNDGKPEYGKVIPCDHPGCLLDQIHAYKQGVPYRQKKGIKPTRTFDTFKPVSGTEEALSLAKKFTGLKEFIWLLIYGGVGNGKTHLANAVANKLCHDGNDARIFTCPDLFTQLRQQMNNNSADNFLEELKRVDTLIIDDYGMEYGTQFEQARLEELLDYRYRELLPTMVVTNKDLKDLPPRLASRFADKEISRIALNLAPDFRVKK